jgi:neutral amino acid transport system ATP-binding protein
MNVLEVHDAHKRFGGLLALDGASLRVEEGSITGLIGPNGSGKTTMFNVITGYERADRGVVSFRGQAITNPRPDRVCGLGIGRTFQITRIFPSLSVRHNLYVGSRAVERSRRAELYADQRLGQLVDFVGLSHLVESEAGLLSFGQRKLLELAIILAQDPKVILLDEPAGGINPTLIDQLADRIKELNAGGVTFLVVEHNMEFVMDLCHEVHVMERGRVIATGSSEQIRSDPRVLDAYLGGSLDDDGDAGDADDPADAATAGTEVVP